MAAEWWVEKATGRRAEVIGRQKHPTGDTVYRFEGEDKATLHRMMHEVFNRRFEREEKAPSAERGLRVLANRAQVTFSESGESAASSPRVVAWVDGGGHVDTRSRDDSVRLVEEWGVCAWQAVGPEDSEPFLTDAMRELLAPQLAALSRDWVAVPDGS